MAFTTEELGNIDIVVGQWCLQKVPPQLKNKIDYDYEVEGQAVTLFEVRPLWRGQPNERTRSAFAKFRYIKTGKVWNIYWMRHNGKWDLYVPASKACTIEEALDIIRFDTYGCFFG